MILDAHVHVIDPARWHYHWLEAGSRLDRAWTLAGYAAGFDGAPPDGGLLLEATNSPAEIPWLIAQAADVPGAWGVVGWIDLDAPDAADQVHRAAGDARFRGVRLNWLHPHPHPAALDAGLTALADRGRVTDVLLDAAHTRALARLIAAHPGQAFVVAHWGGATLTPGGASAWESCIAPLADLPNVALKLSGGGTDDPFVIQAYLDRAIARFGPERLLFGSNYPIDAISGAGQVKALRAACSHLPDAVTQALSGGNTARLYGLHRRTANAKDSA